MKTHAHARRCKALVFMLLVLAVTVVTSFTAYAAGRDISRDAIRSLNISNRQIQDGGTVDVELKYDDSKGSIKEGDVVKINWDRHQDIYFEAYTKDIPLYIEGKHVADAHITTDSATVTFNKNINSLKNVSGWVKFQATARNLYSGREENTRSISVKVGNFTVPVSVTKPASSGTPTRGSFYRKTGDILPNITDKVRWALMINQNKSGVVGDIRISDELQPGQQLLGDSFDIVIQGRINDRFYGADAWKKFNEKYGAASFIVNELDNSIDIKLPRSIGDGCSINVYYKAKITNMRQKTFENNSNAWFESEGIIINGDAFNASVKNIFASAGIDGNLDVHDPVQPIEEVVPSEEVEEIPETPKDNAKETVVEDNAKKVEVHEPEVIYVAPIEEVVPAETVEEISAVETETATETVVEGETVVTEVEEPKTAEIVEAPAQEVEEAEEVVETKTVKTASALPKTGDHKLPVSAFLVSGILLCAVALRLKKFRANL